MNAGGAPATLGDLVTRALPRLSGDISRESWPDRVNSGVALAFGFDFLTTGTFQGAISSNDIAGLRTFSVACEPHLVYRESVQIEEHAPPYYLLTLQVGGSKRIAHRGKSNVVKAGEFSVYDSEAPVTLEVGRGYRSVNIRFPKAGIPDAGDLNELLGEPLSLRDGVASVVWTTLLSLDQNAASIADADAVSLRGHASELAALMLRGRRAKLTTGGGTRSSLRLIELMAYVDAHLGDPELTVESIAAANYLSVRMVHKLFAESGQTPAAWIRERRIGAARRELVDPEQRRSVADIGAAFGFTSMSHFSYVFKRHTGVTPSTYRRLYGVDLSTRSHE